MHSKSNSSTTFSMEKKNQIITLPMSDELNLKTFVVSVRSSRSHNVRASVRPVLTCLEHSIFIFLSQVSELLGRLGGA